MTEMKLTSFSIEWIDLRPHSLNEIDYIRVSFLRQYKTIIILRKNGRDEKVSENKIRYDVSALLDRIAEIEEKSLWLSDYSVSKRCDHMWHMNLWRGRSRRRVSGNENYPPNGEEISHLLAETLKHAGVWKMPPLFGCDQ